ncbi:MAG: hypothetical protein ABEJ93_04850 [Candidatus Nanohalobium sp.]
MREVSPIDKLILEEESGEIGGMIILIIGEPGAGKTYGLTRMVEIDMEYGRIPLWTGQKSCQWIIPAAQGIPVTIWVHDSIEDFEFYTTGSKKDNILEQKVMIDRKDDLDVEIQSFEDPEEIVDDIRTERLNVYYIPGSSGGEKEKYFFQKKNLELAQALNNRRYGDHVTWNIDEVQNVAPDITKKPFHELQMQRFPSEWQDFRKNSVSMRGTGHGYSEINWKYYNNKANGIAYMQGGKVHNDHSKIDQNIVNNMKRGEYVVNGFEAGEFKLPDNPKEVFGWIRKHEDVELKMSFEADIPDIRPTPDDLESVVSELPVEVEDLRSLWTPEEYADEAEVTTRAVQKKLATNKLPGIKLNGKWLMSEEQLANVEDAPF